MGARRCETLNELMSIAGVVSIHAPGSAATAGLIGREAFAHARKDSCSSTRRAASSSTSTRFMTP